MAVAGTLEIQLLANIARLQGDMTQAKGAVGSAMKSIESSVAMAKSALGALGISLGVGYFASLIKGSIDAADHLNDLTQSLGINVRELAKYQLAAAQSGTTLEALGKGVKGIATAFAEHGDELRKAGINAKDTDGRMRQIADVFAGMPDGIEKTTLAVKLFGKSGMELIPMLNMGAAGLAETADKSAKYAAVMATLAPQADKFNDIMAELGMASKVAGMALVNDALPAMSRIAAAMAVAAQQSNIFMVSMVGLGGFVTEGLSGWSRALQIWFLQFSAYLDDAAAKLMRFLGANKDAAMFANSANEAKLKIQQIYEQNTPAPLDPKKVFEPDKWVAQYKKMLAALGLEGKKAGEATNKELERLLALGTKGEIDALTEREKAWREEQKAVLEYKALIAEEDKKLLELGVRGEEEAAVARAAAVMGEMNAINDARNAAFDEEKKRQEDLAAEVKRAADDMNRGLTDALMRGFENGLGFAKNFRDTLVNMFKTLVLRPIISMVLSPVSGAITSTMGGMGISSVANAASGANTVMGWLGGGASTAATASGAVIGTGGAAGTVAAGTMLGGELSVGAASSGGFTAAMAAIPGWGWAALGAAAIGAYLLSGDERTATPQAAGLGANSKIGRGGFSGQQWVGSGSSPTDLWAGAEFSNLAESTLAGFNKAISEVFAGMETAAKQLGLDTSSLATLTVNMGATGNGVQADMQAALQNTADTIALALMPNLRDLQQSGETLAQTFGRLAAAQAALDAQRRTMEIQLLEAQGKSIEALAAKREDELAALDPTLRALQESIYAAQDFTTALQDMAGQLDAARRAANDAVSSQVQTYQDAARAAHQAADAYKQVNTSLAEAVRQLKGGSLSNLTPGQKRDETGAAFQAAWDKSLTGDMASLTALPKLAQDLLESSRALNASGEAYNVDFKNVMYMLDRAGAVSGSLGQSNDINANFYDAQLTMLGELRTAIDAASDSSLPLLQEISDRLSGSASGDAGGLLKELLYQNYMSRFDAAVASFWPSSGSLAAFDANMAAWRAANPMPSHAAGLWSVPYDGYTASLHQDEAVLNRSQAAAWRSGGSGITSADLDALRAEITLLRGEVRDQTGVIRTGDIINAQATEKISQTQANIAAREDAKAGFK